MGDQGCEVKLPHGANQEGTIYVALSPWLQDSGWHCLIEFPVFLTTLFHAPKSSSSDPLPPGEAGDKLS